MTSSEAFELIQNLDQIHGNRLLHIIGFRSWHTQTAFEGLRRSGVPLVAYEDGRFIPAECRDDQGLYWLVPQLMLRTGWPAEKALFCTLAFFLLSSVAVALACLLSLYPGTIPRMAVIVYLGGLTIVTCIFSDVYILLTAAVLLLVPFFLLLDARAPAPWMATGLFALGSVASLFNYLRSDSSTAVLLFVLAWLALSRRWPRSVKALAVLALLLGFMLPQFYFHRLMERREAFLQQQDPAYDGGYSGHALWHVLYISNGFVANRYVPALMDEVSANKAEELAPHASYFSRRYEEVMKRATLSLWRAHPEVLLVNVYVKAVIIFVMFLLFANLGLVAALRFPKPLAVELPFWIALAFESLFGFVSHPQPHYMNGFGAFAALYAVLSINQAAGRSTRR